VVDLTVTSVGVSPLIIHSSRDKGNKTIGNRVKPRTHIKADYFAVIFLFAMFFMLQTAMSMNVIDY
jgi:hypothetical protein